MIGETRPKNLRSNTQERLALISKTISAAAFATVGFETLTVSGLSSQFLLNLAIPGAVALATAYTTSKLYHRAFKEYRENREYLLRDRMMARREFFTNAAWFSYFTAAEGLAIYQHVGPVSYALLGATGLVAGYISLRKGQALQETRKALQK